MEPACHFEQAQRVEKSSHPRDICDQISGKIPQFRFAPLGMTAFMELLDCCNQLPVSVSLRGAKRRGNLPVKRRKHCAVMTMVPGDCHGPVGASQ